jgi:glycosylphosphatidylinositol transamidase (GPIT) subunit GPI8
MDVDEGDHMRPGSASGSKRSNSHTIDLVDERRHDEKTMVVADVESALPMEVDLDEAEDESMMVKRKRVASSMIFNLDGTFHFIFRP